MGARSDSFGSVRIVIFGAGAVGSVIGGRLHQGGADVVLVARPEHAAAVTARGLALRTGDNVETIHVPAVDSIGALTAGASDVVIVTAKTQHVGLIHDDIVRWNRNVAVVCGTNGVEHERMALRRFERVYGMVIQLPATFEKPGEVTALCAPTNALIDVGCYPNGVDETVRVLATLANDSPHVLCEPDEAVMAKKHQKILMNLGNAAEAAIGLSGRGHPAVQAAQAEARELYERVGITTPADDGSPSAVAYKQRAATMQFAVAAGTTFLGGSTWQSLAKGANSVETDYFNGEIVLLGRLHGIATPHNSFLQNLAQDLLTQGAGPASMTADDLDMAWSAASR